MSVQMNSQPGVIPEKTLSCIDRCATLQVEMDSLQKRYMMKVGVVSIGPAGALLNAKALQRQSEIKALKKCTLKDVGLSDRPKVGDSNHKKYQDHVNHVMEVYLQKFNGKKFPNEIGVEDHRMPEEANWVELKKL